ncbi:hypothetical protein PMAYCL1PPCAC_31248, partial [Pristionchus mayeri]
MSGPSPIFARILSLEVPRRFVSADDNQLYATVTFDNDSDLVHSAQVVFRGYVRAPLKADEQPQDGKKERKVDDHQDRQEKKEEPVVTDSKKKSMQKPKKQPSRGQQQGQQERSIYYEFLHEQIWLLIDKQGRVSHEAFLDVWLPRFPPSGPIYKGGPVVEYSCRVSVDPWYQNHHVEQTFEVVRTLILKQPHLAAYPNHIKVNRCVDHGSVFHKQCKPVNGEIWTEKGAYVPGEKFKVYWRLAYSDTLSDAKVSLIKTVKFRTPEPNSPQLVTIKVDTVSSISLAQQREKDKKEDKERKEENCVALAIPEDVPVTMAMTIFNVLSVKYDVLLQVKVGGHKEFTDFTLPVIVTSDFIEPRPLKKRPANKNELFARAIDVDDDSADDDDTDGEVEEHPDSDALRRNDFSIEVENLAVATRADGQLHNAYAEVHLLVNSHVARSLGGLRLLFSGECRAAEQWYEFLRYKAIINTNEATALSPGQHVIKVALPFADAQYDTNILAPSLDDDIRYLCKVTLTSWEANAVQYEREVFVDRYVDTWAKKEYTPPYDEEMGAWGVKMRQRNFQRGMWIFAKVTGDFAKVRFHLVQRRRLRQPGVKLDDSFLHERIIAQLESPEDRSMWPTTEWALQIPAYVQPSIEIAYWNVLVLSYALVVFPRGQDGHEHQHTIPLWIGTTDDKLEPPEIIIPPARPGPGQMVRVPSAEDLPEFEVWDREEVKLQPWWVERFNRDTYTFDEGAPPPPKPRKEDKSQTAYPKEEHMPVYGPQNRPN